MLTGDSHGNHIRKEDIVEEEKREERKEEIVVLDEGIDPEAPQGPYGMCCIGSLTPFRS